MKSLKSLGLVVGVLLAVGVAGTAGYMLIEGWSFFDSLYMTVTTLTTVGYGEVHPLDTKGRVFTTFLIVIGVGGMLYTLTSIVQFAVEGQLTGAVGRRRMKQRIDAIKKHYILCGYGRVGRQIAEELKREGIPLVVIDVNPESVALAAADGLLTVNGNATRDEVLLAAGIERAKGLIAATAEDPDNIYVTLSAHGLRPDLFIVARSNWPESEAKFRRAGANRVISPYAIGGRRMAMLAVRPIAVDFIDTIMHGKGHDWVLEEIGVTSEWTQDAPKLGQVVDRHLPGASILAIVRQDGEVVASPAPDIIIGEGDRLVVLGTRRQLRSTERIQ